MGNAEIMHITKLAPSGFKPFEKHQYDVNVWIPVLKGFKRVEEHWFSAKWNELLGGFGLHAGTCAACHQNDGPFCHFR
jgi:hypothetical protein